jgi:hypothetical protein
MASIIPGFNYDVFISYRQKDNKYDNWVSEFVENLKKELDSTFKERIDVFHDINPLDGLLETYDVNDSLRNKLKCLIFIPVISRTYCDPKSFAWSEEFKTFIDQASSDKFGLKIKLPNNYVASRILPVRIHDLYACDIKQFEDATGFVLRPIDFIYHDIGVNRQLRSKDDNIIRNPNQVLYRDQINKVALAIRDLIEGISQTNEEDRNINLNTNPSDLSQTVNNNFCESKTGPGVSSSLFKKYRKVLFGLIGAIIVMTGLFFVLNRTTDAAIIESGKNYALIVGINNYGDPLIEDLDNPVKDAEMFYDIITSRYNFEKGNVNLLFNATKAEMTKALEYYAGIVQPIDNFLIFYEGHGNWDAASQEGSWIFSDSKKSNSSDWFKNSTLRDYIRNINSKHTLLISDACFDGVVFESTESSIDPLAIDKLYGLRGRRAITSGIRIVVPRNNLFEGSLIESLKKNKQKYLSALSLYKNINQYATSGSGKDPHYGIIKSAGDQGGDFVFILK